MRILLALFLLFVSVSARYGDRESFSSSSSSSQEESNGESPVIRRSSTQLSQILNFRAPREAEGLRGQELVDYVNRKQDLWTARLSEKFNGYDENTKWRLMGVNHVRNSAKARKTLAKSRLLNIDLPENFDAREQWPNCQSLRAIRDQSSCGSCWAFGAVEAMSDRICIASGGKIQVSLSAANLLSCCSSCGFGCDGGEPLEAWNYWQSQGIVTGSNYTTKQGCQPYPFPPCEHHSNKTHYMPCKHELYPTPKCETQCQDSYTEKSYEHDKYYGKSSYAVDNDVKSIQNELYTNGPLEVSFEVYEDFLNYQGGIYIHSGGKLGGGHAVKLIGWGVENGVPYWRVANSWNSDWGEDGFFRIIRGKDECGIESGAVGGIPDLSRTPRDDVDMSPVRRSLVHFIHKHPQPEFDD